MHREVIDRTLARRAGKAPDARAVAEASIDTWKQVTEQLAPVIGERGVDALVGRSLHVSSKNYPWLASAANDEKGGSRLERLKSRLIDREPDAAAAAAASALLLLTFSTLLATMIGEPLTERLLEPVWAPLEDDGQQENAS